MLKTPQVVVMMIHFYEVKQFYTSRKNDYPLQVARALVLTYVRSPVRVANQFCEHYI